MKNSILYILIFIFFVGCKEKEEILSETSEEKTPALFEFLDSNQTGIDFHNSITETEQFNFLLYEYLYNGGGVAVGDINNDGLPDIYFSGNSVSNKLYLNLGNFTFKDITESAGVNGGRGFKTGVSMVDVNNDGLLDIYVCKSALGDPELRRNVLYINNGDLTFTEKAAEYGLDDPGYSVQAYFFDMDGDNDLDVYVLNHSSNMRESNAIKITQNKEGVVALAIPETYEYLSDRLYENKNSIFTDISEKAGVLNDAFGLSAVIGDFNNDGLPDIYVANDYIKPDRLLINQGNNTFIDKIEDYFKHTSFSSMGSDFADINNDGCFDLLTLDMLPHENFRRKMNAMAQNYDKFDKMTTYGLGAQYAINALQLNSCEGNFSNISFMNDIALTEWSWSVLLADFSNNGLKDIHITNGYVRDVTNNDYAKFKMDELQKKLIAKEISLLDWVQQIPSNPVSNFFFENQDNLTFKNTSITWNSGPAAFSNGSAYVDLNNDGFLDIIVNNIQSPPFIMKNMGRELTKNNFLSIDLKFTPKQINIGTIAKAYLSNGTILTEQYNPTRGFLSSSQHRLHFGVPENSTIDKVEIIWPDRKIQVIEKPELNQILSVAKNTTKNYIPEKLSYTYFEDVSKLLPKEALHKENYYIDFKREALLHHKYSEEGPAVSVGDVNGDGLEDLFLGGAMGHAAKLFLQNKNGSFIQNTLNDFEKDKEYEDVSSIFFDANGNGFMDLYVVSGGNERLANDPMYQDRLYINDGKGNFRKSENALPAFFSSGGIVKAHDIDGDGQMDPHENFRRKMNAMAQNYDKFDKMTTYGLGAQYAINALQLNSCEGNFSNISFMNDIALTEWSWSVLLADFSNNGLKDIHITNGYVRDVTNNDYAKFKMDELQKKLIAKEISLLDWVQQIPSNPVSNFFFENQDNLTFKNTSITWNSGPAAFSNGSAYVDLNNDGFLDIIVNNIQSPPFIMKNMGRELTKNNFLSIDLKFTPKQINIGTIAKAYLSNGTILTEQYNPTRGFLSSSQHRLHFGVPENSTRAFMVF
jgi:hypothetical protein